MSDISVEQRLELVKQVRSKYYENQSDMMNREQILYGKAFPKNQEIIRNPRDTVDFYQRNIDTESEGEGIFKDGTLKIRYALAAVAFITIVLLDKSEKTLAGISMNDVFTSIQTDYEETIENWVFDTGTEREIPLSE